MPFNREELAWAAGFFDGEGCVSLQRHKKNYSKNRIGYFSVVVQISQAKSPECLERFLQAVQIGRIHGPRQPYKTSHSIYWLYTAQGFEIAQHVVAVLWPWLSGPKRAQARDRLVTFTKSREGKVNRAHKRRADGRCPLGHPASAIGLRGGCRICNVESARRSKLKQRGLRDANLSLPL